MTGHQVTTCDPPTTRSRRWRNAIWVCPDCGQAWTLVYADRPEFGGLNRYTEGLFWTWWRWPFKAPDYTAAFSSAEGGDHR